MHADEHGLLHERVTQLVLGVFYDVYNELGSGFLESVYEEAMVVALGEAGAHVRRQVPLRVWFRRHPVGYFRADLLVENAVAVELKTARAIDPAHEAQLLNYLRASAVEVGLLLNYGPKAGFKRLVLTNDRKLIRVHPCGSVVPSAAPPATAGSPGR